MTKIDELRERKGKAAEKVNDLRALLQLRKSELQAAQHQRVTAFTDPTQLALAAQLAQALPEIISALQSAVNDAEGELFTATTAVETLEAQIGKLQSEAGLLERLILSRDTKPLERDNERSQLEDMRRRLAALSG